jgi:polysaccharide pyruvyl transferase WcaK-like protein/glycosyltransferase involved in cell wall biosynthesis
MRELEIGAIGWWYYDNQGDLAMLDALCQALYPHHIIPINTDLAFTEDTLTRLNRLDFLLLGGGTLIRGGPIPLFRGFQKWRKRLRTPLGVLGLGVSHVDRDSVPDLHAMIEQSRFFYVRDRTSYELLGHHSVKVAPDITFSHPLAWTSQSLSDRESPLCGVNLRDTRSLDMDAWLAGLRDLPCQWRGIPMSSYDQWQEQKWLRALDASSVSAFSPDLFDGLDVVIGTAFHSVVFAAQAGIPFIAIAYDSKVSRFVGELGLKKFSLSPSAVEELPSRYEDLLDNHAAIRRHLQAERERLVSESRNMFGTIRSVVSAEPARQPYSGSKVSVVIVDNGSSADLVETVASCENQTHRETELIIVSSEQIPHEIDAGRVVSPPREVGPASRVNAGIAKATGEYLMCIRAGDRLSLDALEVLAARLEESGADAVYGGYYTMDNGKITLYNRVHPPYKLMRHNVASPCFLYRRRLHETVGPFDERSPLPLYDFWLRCARNHRLVPVQTPLFFIPIERGSESVELDRHVRRAHSGRLSPLRKLLWKVADSSIANWGLRALRGGHGVYYQLVRQGRE